ncbi:hypothetical protein RRG08_025773 [Elysia crispata]|uniref:Uncharacterized protein n=1 Tax=Elysia crispata TaxID=231223 RepID=A0AAE1AIS1_9GAST|nr:hypothetical protein RRG08_025773 [Elysia crispata]
MPNTWAPSAFLGLQPRTKLLQADKRNLSAHPIELLPTAHRLNSPSACRRGRSGNMAKYWLKLGSCSFLYKSRSCMPLAGESVIPKANDR